MALEDLSMMRGVPDCAVLYPCDAVSTERLVVEMARHTRLAYMRTSRPKTPVIYGPDETFPIGGSKILRQSGDDEATVIGVGVTRVRGAQGLRSAVEGGNRHPRYRRLLAPADRRKDDDRSGQCDRRRARHRRGSLPDRRAWRCGQRGGAAAGFAVAGWRCAKSPAAASPTSCSIATASRPATSSTRSNRRSPPQCGHPPAWRTRRQHGQPGSDADAEHPFEQLTKQLRTLAEQIEQLVAIDPQRDPAPRHCGGFAERPPDNIHSEPSTSPGPAGV